MWAPHERTRVLVRGVDCEGLVGEAILESHTRMHGRGKTAATLASVVQATPLPAVGAVPFFFFFFPLLTLAWLGPIRTESGWFAPTRAVSVRIGWSSRFRLKFKDFSRPSWSVTHCSSSSSSSLLRLIKWVLFCFFFSFFFLKSSVSFDKNNLRA